MTGDSDDTQTALSLPTDIVQGEADIAVSATPVAEAPSFSGPTSFSGDEEGSFALAGIGVTSSDSDDTLGESATLSGLSPGWTLYDGAMALTAGGGVATLPTADLGALTILAPDDGGETATLTLTVSASEGSSTTTASETLVVSATDTAGALSSSGLTNFSDGAVSGAGTPSTSGGEEGSIAPSGIGVTGASNDAVTLAPLVVSGIASGGTASDTVVHGSGGGSRGARSGALAATDTGARVEIQWQGYNAGSWWNIPIALSSDTSDPAAPTVIVRGAGEHDLGIRVEATYFDATGQSVATVDSPWTGPVYDISDTLSSAGTDIGALVVRAPGTGGQSDTLTLWGWGNWSEASSTFGAAAAVATTTIDPTVDISGSPIEGSTLTASAVVTGGFTGTTEFHWQRFYAGGWWDIPTVLSPYPTTGTLTYVTGPTYVVREEDENVTAIRVEADFVDTTGQTVATVDSPSIGPVLDEPATLSLSPITGSWVANTTLTVSGLVTSDEFTGAPVYDWERYYLGSWWPIPTVLSPYPTTGTLDYVTTPTYVVRAEDDAVLAIRVEASYIDDTGQTFTVDSAAEVNPLALTVDGGSTVPVGSAGAAAVVFTVDKLSSNDSGSVVFSDGTHSATVAIVSGTAAASTVNLSAFDDDTTITASLLVNDPAGNTFTAARTNLTLDQDAGDAVTLTAASLLSGSAGAGAVKFVVSGNLDDEAGFLTLTDGAASTAAAYTGNGTYTFDLSGSSWSDGAVSSTLTVSDPAGNSFTAAGAAVTLDKDAGASASVIGPSGTLGSASASAAGFTVGTPDGDESGSLTLSEGTFQTVLAVSGAGTYTADLSGWADGTVSAALVVSDAAGNSFSAGTSVVIDPDAGASANLTGPVGTLDAASASAAGFTVGTPDGDESGSLTLSEGTFQTVLAVSGSGTYTADLSAWPDGTVSAALLVSDAAGNSFSAGTSVVIDPDVSETVGLIGGTTFNGGASVTLSGIGTSPLDGDDTVSATLIGLSAGWTLFDTNSGLSFTTASITAIPVSDLGSLVVSAPLATAAATDLLTLSISWVDDGSTTTATTSEVLTLVANNLSGADLSGHDLNHQNLSNADLSNTNLSGANLTGTILTNANLTGANLSNSISGSADLSGADLSGANLTGADLTGANLSNANLSNANLSGTNLSGVNLTGANLTGANLPLQLSALGASLINGGITGEVLDGFTGSVTINAFDQNTNQELDSVTISYSAANALESWSISNLSFTASDLIIVTAQDSEGLFYTATEFVAATAPAGVAGSPINLALTDPTVAGSIAVTVAGIPRGWSLNAGTDLGNGTWTVETGNPSALAVSPAAGFVGATVLSLSERWINADGSSGREFVTDNIEAYAPEDPIFALSGDDTLTGSGANDLFVFAQPIGNDQIFNFKPAGNRIDLIGFSGLSSFADLQAKIADDASGNAVLTLGSGETITLVGVDAVSLGAGNFLFDKEPTTSNAGSMTIGDGAVLPLGGTVDNAGTIALNSAGGGAELVVLSDGVTLRGGGEVILSDDAGNAIVGSGADTTLTNLDNIISGAGRLGDDVMTLSNAGVIDATGTKPLIIDTGGNSIANSGTIEATGAGGLVIRGAVVNSGTLSAASGTLTVDGAVTGNGIAMIAGTATLEFGAASAENTSFASGAAGTLKLDQPAAFTGAVSGFAAGDAIDLSDLAFGHNTVVSYADNGAGGGTLTVGDGVQVVDLALLGQYAAAGFQARSDPGGGILITYTLQAGAADPTSLTAPSH